MFVFKVIVIFSILPSRQFIENIQLSNSAYNLVMRKLLVCRFQTMSVTASPNSTLDVNVDLTGSVIMSDKPVTVYCGI